jgi:hypothetical protein
MVKYSYLEKACLDERADCVLSSNVPTAFLVAIAFTDMIWIPLFIWVHVTVARTRHERRLIGRTVRGEAVIAVRRPCAESQTRKTRGGPRSSPSART